MIGRTVLGGRPKLEKQQTSGSSEMQDVDLDQSDNDVLPVVSNEDATFPENESRVAATLLQKISYHYQSTIAKVPPRYKYLCFFLWVAWKVVAVFLVYYVFQGTSQPSHIPWVPLPQHSNNQVAKVRILYVVTSSVDITMVVDAATRNKGDARSLISQHLAKSIPLVKQNAANIANTGYHVDIVWMHEDSGNSTAISDGHETDYYSTFHYLAREALPSDVGLSFWPHASSFEMDSTSGRLIPPFNRHTNLIQRQAFRVIRDAFPLYHFFLVWPDVARIRGSSVDNFWKVSQEIDKDFVPAIIPVTNAFTPGANSTYVKGIKSEDVGEDTVIHAEDLLGSTSAKLIANISFEGLRRRGPQVITARGTQSMVQLRKSQWQSYGFMATRAQLAQHQELLEKCLVRSHTLPIAWPRNESTEKLCMVSDQGILLANNLVDHVIDFVENSQIGSATRQQNLSELIKKVKQIIH